MSKGWTDDVRHVTISGKLSSGHFHVGHKCGGGREVLFSTLMCTRKIQKWNTSHLWLYIQRHRRWMFFLSCYFSSKDKQRWQYYLSYSVFTATLHTFWTCTTCLTCLLPSATNWMSIVRKNPSHQTHQNQPIHSGICLCQEHFLITQSLKLDPCRSYTATLTWSSSFSGPDSFGCVTLTTSNWTETCIYIDGVKGSGAHSL